MRPSDVLEAILRIESEAHDLEAKIAPFRERLEILGFARADIRALLNNGAPWEKIAERLSDFAAGIVPDAIEEISPAKPDDAPYGRRADGTPKARPGRKAKEAPAVNLSPGETERTTAPVDQEKNAADIRTLTAVLTAYGPCPPSVLLHRSGLDADTIGAHVRAAAVIESYDGEYAMEGGKLMPSIMIRLISQRPS